MTSSISLTTKPAVPKKGVLVCRLRQKNDTGDQNPLPHTGEFELENVSGQTIEIRYQMSPLQYVTLLATRPDGTSVADREFADRFSPMAEEKVLLLNPGEVFASDIPLMGTVSRPNRNPGIYKVQVVYEYDGIRIESNQVEVKV